MTDRTLHATWRHRVKSHFPGHGASGPKLRRMAKTTSLIRVPERMRLSCVSNPPLART